MLNIELSENAKKLLAENPELCFEIEAAIGFQRVLLTKEFSGVHWSPSKEEIIEELLSNDYKKNRP